MQDFQAHPIREIAREIKKQYKSTWRSIQKLTYLGILKKEKIGSYRLWKLDLKNYQCKKNLVLIESHKVQKLFNKNKDIKNITEETIKKCLKHSSYFTLIIFGSYAKGTATKHSDLDILILVQDEETKRKITNTINKISLFSPIKLNPKVIKAVQFMEMLREKTLNVGKEIVKNHLIPYGAEAYYEILAGEQE